MESFNVLGVTDAMYKDDVEYIRDLMDSLGVPETGAVPPCYTKGHCNCFKACLDSALVFAPLGRVSKRMLNLIFDRIGASVSGMIVIAYVAYVHGLAKPLKDYTRFETTDFDIIPDAVKNAMKTMIIDDDAARALAEMGPEELYALLVFCIEKNRVSSPKELGYHVVKAVRRKGLLSNEQLLAAMRSSLRNESQSKPEDELSPEDALKIAIALSALRRDAALFGGLYGACPGDGDSKDESGDKPSRKEGGDEHA